MADIIIRLVRRKKGMTDKDIKGWARLQISKSQRTLYTASLRRWFVGFLQRMRDIGIDLEEKMTQQQSHSRGSVTAESIEEIASTVVRPMLNEW